MQAKQGQWVQVHNIVLKSDQRAANLPDDTKKVDLEMWVKGNITADTEVGGECEVITMTGRTVKGTLVEIEPRYAHDFGDYVPELDAVKKQARGILWEGSEA